MKQDKKFVFYFPDYYPKGRQPEREYFFNVLNTLQPSYMDQLIKKASKQRHSVLGGQPSDDVVNVSNDWWEKLNSQPYISSKSFSISNYS